MPDKAPAVTPLEILDAFRAQVDGEDKEFDAVSAIVIVAEVVDKDGQQGLVIWRDRMNGIWKHIGMVAVVDGDLLADCQEPEYEYDEEED